MYKRQALGLLRRYENDDFDEAFFDELDADNGASKLAKLIIEECTELNLFVGKAMNTAHQNSNLPFDLSVRMNLVEQLRECIDCLLYTSIIIRLKGRMYMKSLEELKAIREKNQSKVGVRSESDTQTRVVVGMATRCV